MLLVLITGLSHAKYEKEIEIPFINARVGAFKENDIQLAMKLDGEQVEAPPEKNSLYTVTVDCDNADGEWDSDRWGAIVTNITAGKVKCEVNFTTPEPTLTSISATAEKTSIALSYTASGIGVSTTCAYGIDTNYGSTVEGATNANCNITGLEMDTLYYYKVCAKNHSGELCKEGSIKTKPNYMLADHVNIGDYISMTPTSTSYKLSNSLSGCSGTSSTCTQDTLNPSELNLWRVIRKNSDGTVDIISNNVSSTTVKFHGLTGYINFIKGLNTVAAQYTDGKHVKKTRHFGYSYQTEALSSSSKLTQTKAPWSKSTSNETNKFEYTSCDSGTYLCGAYESYGGGDVYYAADYNDLRKVYSSAKAQDPAGTTKDYYIASRMYDVTSEDTFQFSGRYITQYGGFHSSPLCGYIAGTFNTSMGKAVRPIVTLDSASELSSGSGTSGSPYTLK